MPLPVELPIACVILVAESPQQNLRNTYTSLTKNHAIVYKKSRNCVEVTSDGQFI